MTAKHCLVVEGEGGVAVSASTEMSQGESTTFPSLYIMARASNLSRGRKLVRWQVPG